MTVRSLATCRCALALLVLLAAGCDRTGPNRTVLDWEIYLDVRSIQALERWMAGDQIDTYRLGQGSIHRTIEASRWFKGDTQRSEGPVPSTTISGTVTEAPAPLAPAADLPVEAFPHPLELVLRDHATGAELTRRDLTPGYNTFKTFIDASDAGEAGFLYRGNLLLVTPLDWGRGRHQSITISVFAPGTTPVRQAPAMRLR